MQKLLSAVFHPAQTSEPNGVQIIWGVTSVQASVIEIPDPQSAAEVIRKELSRMSERATEELSPAWPGCITLLLSHAFTDVPSTARQSC